MVAEHGCDRQVSDSESKKRPSTSKLSTAHITSGYQGLAWSPTKDPAQSPSDSCCFAMPAGPCISVEVRIWLLRAYEAPSPVLTLHSNCRDGHGRATQLYSDCNCAPLFDLSYQVLTLALGLLHDVPQPCDSLQVLSVTRANAESGGRCRAALFRRRGFLCPAPPSLTQRRSITTRRHETADLASSPAYHMA